MNVDEKLRIIRNWSYDFTIKETDRGLWYARMQYGAHMSFGFYTNPHTYRDDLIEEMYQMTYEFISESMVKQ